MRTNGISQVMVVSMMVVLSSCKPESRTNPRASSSVKWTDPGTLVPGPVRTSLSTEQVERVAKLQQTFQDVDANPLLKSGAPDEEVIAHVKLKVLSIADAKD